jgi:hypothetical protein
MNLRKSVFALAAVLTLGLAPATDVSARSGGGGGHGGGGGGHSMGGGGMGGRGVGWSGGGAHFATPNVGARIVAPNISRPGPGPVNVYRSNRPGIAAFHAPGRFFVRGHHRHFWHGRWWAYGVGSCWAWSDDYGEYVWVCGDDDYYDY